MDKANSDGGTAATDTAGVNAFHPWSPSPGTAGTAQRTLLMVAAYAGNVGLVEMLVKQGAEPNLRSPDDGRTALHLCIEGRSSDTFNVIKALLQHGADREVKDKAGQTPLDLLTKLLDKPDAPLPAPAEGVEQEKDDFDWDKSEYKTADFNMYAFKIEECTRTVAHDWTECPFAHPGEKARRRDPRKYAYTSVACPDFRKGNCKRGVACEFSHGVFECWLHPSKYRTQVCKDGAGCTRRVCFFAHNLQELRHSTEEDALCPLASENSDADTFNSSPGSNISSSIDSAPSSRTLFHSESQELGQHDQEVYMRPYPQGQRVVRSTSRDLVYNRARAANKTLYRTLSAPQSEFSISARQNMHGAAGPSYAYVRGNSGEVTGVSANMARAMASLASMLGHLQMNPTDEWTANTSGPMLYHQASSLAGLRSPRGMQSMHGLANDLPSGYMLGKEQQSSGASNMMTSMPGTTFIQSQNMQHQQQQQQQMLQQQALMQLNSVLPSQMLLQQQQQQLSNSHPMVVMSKLGRPNHGSPAGAIMQPADFAQQTLPNMYVSSVYPGHGAPSMV